MASQSNLPPHLTYTTHLLKKQKPTRKKLLTNGPFHYSTKNMKGWDPLKPVLIFFSSIIIALVQGQFCVGVGDLEEC